MKIMRNLLIGLLMCFFTSMPLEVSADTIYRGDDLWATTVTVNGQTYDVLNRSKITSSESYNSTYFGYEDTSENGYTGFYIGTVTKNNNIGNGHKFFLDFVLSYIEFINMNVNGMISIDAKIYSDDPDDDSDDPYHVDYDDDIKPDYTTTDDGLLTVYWGNATEGTWKFADNSNYGFGFYAVKSAGQLALYYVVPEKQEGVWTTRHLVNNGGQTPDISHFRGTPSDYYHVVPEPASLLLLGAGLLGVGFAARRRGR